MQVSLLRDHTRGAEGTPNNSRAHIAPLSQGQAAGWVGALLLEVPGPVLCSAFGALGQGYAPHRTCLGIYAHPAQHCTQQASRPTC